VVVGCRSMVVWSGVGVCSDRVDKAGTPEPFSGNKNKALIWLLVT
jgi:hypothetical protein